MESEGQIPRQPHPTGTRLPAMAALRIALNCLVAVAALVPPQIAPAQSAAAPASNQPEVTTKDSETPFKLKTERNLVVVRVVVRDVKGNAVRGLHKEDFRLLDNGKPQIISQFSMEGAAAGPPATPSAPNSRSIAASAEAASLTSPDRFLALFFDDVHMSLEDIMRARTAANQYLTGALKPSDRVSIDTSSGQGVLDFTDDLDKIHDALLKLQPRPIAPREANPCPDLTPYQAFQMVEQREPFAIEIANEEDLACRFDNDPRRVDDAARDADAAAARELNFSETESQAALRGLDQLVRRMSVLPGQRNIVLVSPGFMTETQRLQIGEVVDRALRMKVIVNTLDSKGLAIVQPLGDLTQSGVIIPVHSELLGNKSQMRLNEFNRNSDVLAEFAESTGGVFFHNSNDLQEGFRRVSSLPEIFYVLSFSPSNLKMDGRLHALSVKLPNSKGLVIQARHGYYAPSKLQDAAEEARQEIQDAIFSQDVLNGVPIEVHTQFFRVDAASAKLSVLTHVDVRSLQFRKQAGRNLNNLTLVTILFDRNGNYVTGAEKNVEMRLLDQTRQRLAQSGITMKTSFDVKPGAYMVREVVRDEEGAQISGTNRSVDIPE